MSSIKWSGIGYMFCSTIYLFVYMALGSQFGGQFGADLMVILAQCYGGVCLLPPTLFHFVVTFDRKQWKGFFSNIPRKRPIKQNILDDELNSTLPEVEDVKKNKHYYLILVNFVAGILFIFGFSVLGIKGSTLGFASASYAAVWFFMGFSIQDSDDKLKPWKF